MSLDPSLLCISRVVAMRPTPYQHQLLSPTTESSHYAFDQKKTSLPRELSLAIPEDVRHASNIVRQKANAALKGYLYLEKKYSERYYRLCPLKPTRRAMKHINSIDRLLGWNTNYNDFAVASAKIPTCVISFKVDEAAYSEFSASFNIFRKGYIDGPYRTWINADSYFRNFIDSANMPMYTRLKFIEWWNGYRAEMRPWEEKVDSLKLPSWQSIVAELADIAEERLDLHNEWDIWV
ncbi:hypothetical protein FQN49_001709 [Arthroderma sp. PD_2]|nr:hypothetical protein FQN49_001709 [Arthroderma sp. PD_2]